MASVADISHEGVTWTPDGSYALVESEEAGRAFLAKLRNHGYVLYVDNMILFTGWSLGDHILSALLEQRAECLSCHKTIPLQGVRQSGSKCKYCRKPTMNGTTANYKPFHLYQGKRYATATDLPVPKFFMVRKVV